MRFSSLMVLLVWLLITDSQTLEAQNEKVYLELKSHRKAKVCGTQDDKRIQVSINLGEILPIDSLYFFEAVVQYDTAKIKFETGLYVNTLAEFFDQKEVNANPPGHISFGALNWSNNTVYGNRPLIAFEASYRDKCPDTILIKLVYFDIEVSENYFKNIDFSKKELYIPVEVKETNYSFVETKFVLDSINDFSDDSTASVICKLNTNNLFGVDEFDLNLDYKDSQYLELVELKNLHDNIEFGERVDTVEDGIRKTKIHILLNSSINEENILELKFRKSGNEYDTTKLNMYITNINECSCATKFFGDSLVILTEKDTTKEDTTNVSYNIEKDLLNIDGFYSYLNEEFIINSDYVIKKIKLYDLNGRLVGIKDDEIGYKMIMDVRNLNYGVYLVNVLLQNGFENNIVLIKN